MILKVLTEISRILVGSLFIVSGLIKSNDILGFVYKLEEYFEPGAYNLPGLVDYALPIAIFVVIGEILLGVALLMGALPKLTTVLALFMMIFFTFLTGYTSMCEEGTVMITNAAGALEEIQKQCVTECGCFGNAIPLTAYQSFIKDIIILIIFIPFVISVILGKIKLNTMIENKYVIPGSLIMVSIFSYGIVDWLFPILFTGICLLVSVMILRRVRGKNKEWFVAGAILIISALFQYQTYYHLPMKDYRPYAVGENLIENRKSAEELGLTPPVYAYPYSFRNKETGVDSIVWSYDYSVFVKTDRYKTTFEKHDKTFEVESVLITDGYEAKILDLNPSTFEDGEEVLETILADPGYTLVFVSKDLAKVKKSQIEGLKELSDKFQEAGHKMSAWVATDYETATQFKHENQLSFDFCEMDFIESKIIIRSNPGLMLLHNGVVVQKWAWKDFPTFENLNDDYIK